MTATVTTGETPAAAGSPLASLRDRKAKLVEKLYLDLKVPRWDDDGGPAIFVRYHPAKLGKVASASTLREKQRKQWGDDWALIAQADVLIDCCAGIYASENGKRADDPEVGDVYSLRPGDPTGDWTTFDPDLAANLGLDEHAGAVATCRALYLTEGDLTLAYTALIAWSGDVSDDTEETNRGN